MNLQRHVENMRKFDLPVVVALNRFTGDTEAEYAAIRAALPGVRVILCAHWAEGGAGAADLADAVIGVIGESAIGEERGRPLYPAAMPLAEKIRTVAREIYRAADIALPASIARRLAGVRGCRPRRPSGLHRQDPVQLQRRSHRPGRSDRPHPAGARGPPVRWRRVRGRRVR